MICLTSRKPRRGRAGLFGVVLSVLALATDTSQAAESATPDTIDARLVTRLALKSESRPQWARFSPANPNLVLVDLDDRGVLVSLPQGTTRRIAKELSPVGWLGQAIVVRGQGGSFRLIDADDLALAGQVAAGALSLPWTFGKNRRLRFDAALPKSATSAIPLLIPGAEAGENALVAHEERAAAVVAHDDTGRNVVDADGRVLFRGGKKIYGISLSPDTYKLVVYYGNTEHVLFNRLTRRTALLPSSIHAWSWLPDSGTLLGEISLGGKPGREEVTSTDLYVYEPAGARLERIKLPPPARGVALKILDISTDGQILVEAERVVPEPAYLGLMVLELLWGPNTTGRSSAERRRHPHRGRRCGSKDEPISPPK